MQDIEAKEGKFRPNGIAAVIFFVVVILGLGIELYNAVAKQLDLANKIQAKESELKGKDIEIGDLSKKLQEQSEAIENLKTQVNKGTKRITNDNSGEINNLKAEIGQLKRDADYYKVKAEEEKPRKVETTSFFFEDFRNYEPGSTANEWGQDLIIKATGSGATKIISCSLKERTVTLAKNITFPKDFAFELEFLNVHSNNYSLALIDEAGKQINVLWNADADNNRMGTIYLPKANARKYATKQNQLVYLKLVKEGDVLEAYVDKILSATGDVSGYSQIKSFALTLNASQGATNFKGIVLEKGTDD